MERLMRGYGLNPKLVRQVLDSDYVELFEVMARDTRVSPITIAVALTETLKALKREGVEIDKISDEQIKGLFHLLDSGEAAKEAIPEILAWLAKHEEATAKEAVENLGLAMISGEELDAIIGNLIKENASLVKEKGKSAFGPLMGMIMKNIRGRAKAEQVSEILRKKLEKSFQ